MAPASSLECAAVGKLEVSVRLSAYLPSTSILILEDNSKHQPHRRSILNVAALESICDIGLLPKGVPLPLAQYRTNAKGLSGPRLVK